MHIPEWWGDKGILEDEPFRSLAVSHSTLRCEVPNLARQIMAQDASKQAAEKWLRLAFLPDPKGPRNKTTGIKVDATTASIFVTFYFHCARGDEANAANYLNEQRSLLGFASTIEQAYSFRPITRSHKVPRDRPFPNQESLLAQTPSRRGRSTTKREERDTVSVPNPVSDSTAKTIPAKRAAPSLAAAGVVAKKPNRKSKRREKRFRQRRPEDIATCVKSEEVVESPTFDLNASLSLQLTTSTPANKYDTPLSPLSPVSTSSDILMVDSPLDGVDVGRGDFTPPTDKNLPLDEKASFHLSTASVKDPSVVSSPRETADVDVGVPNPAPSFLTPSNKIKLLEDDSAGIITGALSQVAAPRSDSFASISTSFVPLEPPNLALDNDLPSPSTRPSFKILDNDSSLDGTTLRLIHDDDIKSLENNRVEGGQIPRLEPPPVSKPIVPCLPKVWAQSRQEVCESFDWFRSYQGGVYFVNNVTKGYLLSAFSSDRDRFEHNGKLIISHGGGKAESPHASNGTTSTQLADDQLAQDKSVRALLTNYRERRPLVLLVDDKYTLFPYDLGAKDVTYAVLGYYIIAYAWAEYQPAKNDRGRVVRFKFAFQWCEGQDEPWWWGAGADTSMACIGVENPISQLVYVCQGCGQNSPKVYQPSWVCLNSNCHLFWRLQSGFYLPLHRELVYDEEFLRLLPHEHRHLPRGFHGFNPSSGVKEGEGAFATTYGFSRGMHCSDCGRLSCRLKWQYWECAHCKKVLECPMRIHLAQEFWKQPLLVTFQDHELVEGYGIFQYPERLFLHSWGVGTCQSFRLPHGRGYIHHIKHGAVMANHDADQIFNDYQIQARSGKLAFRRWPLRSHKLRGPLLTNYFSQNTGEPYQYVGGTANTVPFESATTAVIGARNLIQKRLREALHVDRQFNEILSAAYMERQKMAFHSDAEEGLGPVVAGLSLGAPALMHFRLHPKYDTNKSPNIKGTCMTFVLRHGDILVMDGAQVQEYYEHAVVPTNFRMSATARWINPPPALRQPKIEAS